jgi:alkane 1-monooxygenase
MLRDFKYLFAYLIPASGLLALQWQGLWSWATLILAFGILPIFDALLPASTANIPAEQEDSRSKLLFFDLLLYACAPICYVLVALFLHTVQTQALSTSELWGLSISIGIVLGATGINVAHELGHRNNPFEQWLAKAGLLLVLYQHFFIEHNRGHHKNVSTPLDPATARRGEMVYTFVFRSILGQYRDAWQLERQRLADLGQGAWTWQNQMIRFAVYQSLYLLLIAWWFGWSVLPFALAIALVGVLLLEIINYIEHYGLVRQLLPSGKYEPVLPRHSWNSDHEMGRIVLFELTRHSDHHYKAARKYQILRHIDQSPQLPLGYPGSMLLSLIPPLWFAIMDRRLAREQEAMSKLDQSLA